MRVAEEALYLAGGDAKHVRMTILVGQAFVGCVGRIEMVMDFLPVSCTVLMIFLWKNYVVGESKDLGDDISRLINQGPPPAYQTQEDRRFNLRKQISLGRLDL